MSRSHGKTILSLLAITVVVVLGIYFVIQLQRPLVTVTQVVEGPVVSAFYATGTVAPDREYPIKSNVAGILVEMRVDKGSPVTRGQILAIVRSDDLALKLEQAKAQYQEKRSRADEKASPVLAEFDAKTTAFTALLEIAQRDVDRQNKLLAQGNGAQGDLDKALERLKAVWSDAESNKAQKAAKKLELEKDAATAKAALDIAQWNYDQQSIHSPIDGVVLDRPASAGTRLAINDALLRIADVRPQALVMRAQVDEEDRAKLRDQQPVILSLYAFPHQPMTGKVSRIYPQADTDRRTFEVDVSFDQPDSHLAPGMTGELAFEIARRERAAVIPAQAVQGGAVWVVRDGQLQRSDATIGLKSVERAEVLDGLRATDLVLVSPVGTMQSGQSVRLQHTDPRAAAALNRPAEKTDSFKGFN